MKLDELKGKGILIHHWDADGICSARLILEKMGDKIVENKTPVLGNYFLTDEEINQYKKFDFVIIADMSLPKKNIESLAKDTEVCIFDHHLGEEIESVFHYNPVIKGENPDSFPSASWIVNDFLGNSVNLFALLGVVGDHEEKIKKNEKFYSLIQDFCEENNLSFDDLLKMIYLLDSNYKKGDKEQVENAPHVLLKKGEPEDILGNKLWNKNRRRIKEEIEEQLDSFGEKNGTVFKKMDTGYNIISTVTRRLSWGTGKNAIVVNTGFFDDQNQVYIRSNSKDMTPLIERGKQLGFKCGGKKEVMGAIIPKQETEGFVEEAKNFFMEEK